MKRIAKLALGTALIASAFAANAAVIATVNLGGGNPYWNDYDIYFGLGSTSTPTWQQQVARAYDSTDGFGGTASLDISALWNSLGGQDWWVLVDDNWGANASYLTNFSIDTGSKTFIATGLPVYISDTSYAYAHITTTATTVPEPGTLALGSAALLGIGLLRRREKAAR